MTYCMQCPFVVIITTMNSCQESMTNDSKKPKDGDQKVDSNEEETQKTKEPLIKR